MAKFEIRLPAMGEGIIEATITRWFVSEGSYIKEDDPLVEVATDKVDSEIPSPYSGYLKKIVYSEGEIPKVGEVIAIITSEENDEISSEPVLSDPGYQQVNDNSNSVVSEPEKMEIYSEIREHEQSPSLNSNGFLSPFIINLAKQRGITLSELNNIRGTGENNRVTKQDLLHYILHGRPLKNNNNNPHIHKTEVIKKKDPEEFLQVDDNHGVTDVVEMDRIRKLIADNMLKSKRTAPHVTSFAEADVTNMVIWREKIKEEFLTNENVNLTYTSLITEVVAKVLKEFPRINSSVDGDKILIKKEINIGIATALKDGNLVVPVIKNTDKENIRGLAHKIYSLASNARQNSLQISDIRGGTFTITNIGQYKSITGTPIINQPEVAILAIGTIRKKPAVVEVQGKLSIGIRDIVMLSLTYDHRIIDGALGGEFLYRIVQNLEAFDLNRSW